MTIPLLSGASIVVANAFCLCRRCACLLSSAVRWFFVSSPTPTAWWLFYSFLGFRSREWKIVTGRRPVSPRSSATRRRIGTYAQSSTYVRYGRKVGTTVQRRNLVQSKHAKALHVTIQLSCECRLWPPAHSLSFSSSQRRKTKLEVL